MQTYRLVTKPSCSNRFIKKLIPGALEFTINEVIDKYSDLSVVCENYHNDETGAIAYSPAIMSNFKIWLFMKKNPMLFIFISLCIILSCNNNEINCRDDYDWDNFLLAQKKVLKIIPLDNKRICIPYDYAIRLVCHPSFENSYVKEIYFDKDFNILYKHRESDENIWNRYFDFHHKKNKNYKDKEMLDYLSKIKVASTEKSVLSEKIYKNLLNLDLIIRNYTPPFEEKTCLDGVTYHIEVYNACSDYFIHYNFRCPSLNSKEDEILKQFENIVRDIEM